MPASHTGSPGFQPQNKKKTEGKFVKVGVLSLASKASDSSTSRGDKVPKHFKQ